MFRLLYCFFILFHFNSFAHRTVIVGKTVGFDVATIFSIGEVTDPITYSQSILGKTIVDSSGNFKIITSLKDEGVYYLLFNEEEIQIYLSPGDSIGINLNYNDSLQVSFTGNNEKLNNYLFIEDVRQTGRSTQKMHKSAGNLHDYNNFLDSLLYTDFKFRASYFSDTKDLKTTNFLFLDSLNKVYSWAHFKLCYPRFNAYMNQLKEQTRVPDNYYRFLSHIPINVDSFANNKHIGEFYLQFSLDYLDFLMDNDSVRTVVSRNPSKTYEIKHRLIQENFKRETKSMLFAHWAYTMLTNEKDLIKASDLIEEYNASEGSLKYEQMLNNVFTRAYNLTSGKNSPNFQFFDQNGEKINLSKFKGDTLYLNIWATWCPPCIAELKANKDLIKALDPKFRILNICIGDSKSKWVEVLKKEGISGDNFYCDEKQFIEAYNINGLPRHILIGSRSEIISAYEKPLRNYLKKN